jgi:hypothetical protein
MTGGADVRDTENRRRSFRPRVCFSGWIPKVRTLGLEFGPKKRADVGVGPCGAWIRRWLEVRLGGLGGQFLPIRDRSLACSEVPEMRGLQHALLILAAQPPQQVTSAER